MKRVGKYIDEKLIGKPERDLVEAIAAKREEDPESITPIDEEIEQECFRFLRELVDDYLAAKWRNISKCYFREEDRMKEYAKSEDAMMNQLQHRMPAFYEHYMGITH